MRKLLIVTVSLMLCIPMAASSASKKQQLINAAKWGQTAKLKKLLGEGMSANTRDNYGRSLLMLAVKYKRYHVVKTLLNNNVPVSAKDRDGKIVLHYMAARYGRHAVNATKAILNNSISNKYLINRKDEKGNTVLHLAALYNNTALIKLLLKYDPNLNSKNRKDKTALIIAVEKNRYYPAATLIKAKANYKIKDNSGKSAIDYAAGLRSSAIFKMLLKEGISDTEKNRALFAAAKKKKIKLVQTLIKAGANINYKDREGKTLLHYVAAIKGYWGMRLTKELVKKGAKINAKDDQGGTPAGAAIAAGNYPAIALFLKKGMNVNGSEKGVPYLLYAYEKYQKTIAKLLLKKGADTSVKDNKNRTLLHLAAETNDTRMLVKLMKGNIDLNIQDSDGRTPLMIAVKKKRAYASKLIFDKGADVTKRDRYGQNVFHYLADQWSTYLLKVMEKKGKQPGINRRDNAERTPLSIAFKGGKHGVAAMLMKVGADPNLKDEKGQSLLYLALKLNNYKLVKMLVDNGMDVNKPIDNNEFPLFLAIEKRNRHLVKLFLDKGANVKMKNSSDETPAALAIEKNNAYIVKLILDKGADPNAKTAKGIPLLLRAYEKFNIYSFNHLLKAKADPNIGDGSGRPLIINACMFYNRRFFLKSLVKYGANLNVRDKKGNTPLLVATDKNQYTAALYLLSDKNNKPDLEAKNRRKETALFIAAKKGRLAILNLLLKKGANANVKNKYGDTLIIRAAATPRNRKKTANAIKIIKIFVKNGADINAKNRYSNSALDKAISKSNPEMVAFLIKSGANVNQTDKRKSTPLQKVVRHYINTRKYSDGIRKMIYLLLKNGAKINLQDKHGRTALIIACKQMRESNKEKAIDAAQILIENGANKNIKDKYGKSAMDYARSKGNSDLVAALSGRINSGGSAGTWRTHLVGSSDDDKGLKLSSDSSGNIYLYAKNGSKSMFYKFNKRGQFRSKMEIANGRGAIADKDGNLYILGLTTGKINGKYKDRCSDGENIVPYITKKNSGGLDLWTTYLGRKWACKKTDSIGLIQAGDRGILVHEKYFNKYNYFRFIDTNGKAIKQTYVTMTPTVMKIDGEGHALFKYKGFLQVNKYNKQLWRLWRLPLPKGWKDLYTAKSKLTYVVGQENDTSIYVNQYGKWNRFKWTKRFSSGSTDKVRKVIADEDDNVYILGETSGSMMGQRNQGGTDFFIIKLDKSSKRKWVVQFGSSGDDRVGDIHITNDGSIIVTGSSEGKVGSERNSGDKDACIFKISPQGALYSR